MNVVQDVNEATAATKKTVKQMDSFILYHPNSNGVNNMSPRPKNCYGAMSCYEFSYNQSVYFPMQNIQCVDIIGV